MARAWENPVDAFYVGGKNYSGDPQFSSNLPPEQQYWAKAYGQTIAIAQNLLGRYPTQDEFSAALPFVESGGATGSVAFWQNIVTQKSAAEAKATADSESAAAKTATSSFLSAFAPYSSLATAGLSPSEALALINLQQSARSNELSLQEKQRASTGGPGNGAINAQGGGPANPVTSSGSSKTIWLFLAGLAAAVFFLFRKT